MAGTMKFHGKKGAAIAEINITPLVDVCLVLVIIMMVAATAIVAKTLKVQLPRAAHAEGPAAKPITVVLLKDGTIHLKDGPDQMEDHEVKEPEVRKQLEAAGAKDAETSLVISADKDVIYDRVAHMLDLAAGAKITKIAMNVQGGG
jgi:biopolymer transport protein ExbD